MDLASFFSIDFSISHRYTNKNKKPRYLSYATNIRSFVFVIWDFSGLLVKEEILLICGQLWKKTSSALIRLTFLSRSALKLSFHVECERRSAVWLCWCCSNQHRPIISKVRLRRPCKWKKGIVVGGRAGGQKKHFNHFAFSRRLQNGG